MRNFVLNLLLSKKFFVPLQAKSKTYGMRCTPVHMTPLGRVNVADHIVAIGTKASEIAPRLFKKALEMQELMRFQLLF